MSISIRLKRSHCDPDVCFDQRWRLQMFHRRRMGPLRGGSGSARTTADAALESSFPRHGRVCARFWVDAYASISTYQISYMLIHCSGELSRIARHHVWTALVLAVARTAAMAAHEAAIVLQVASICPCRPLFKMMGTAAQTTHAVNARIKKTPPYATCLARLTSPCSPASAAAAAAAAPGGTARSPRRASPAGWARCRSSP